MKQIGTFKTGDTAVIIKFGNETITLSRADSLLKTESQIKQLFTDVKLPEIFAHINDDGSIAIATGSEPDVWPEDEE
jgi:hypothetical protein